jgi:hypothetical protein
MNLEFMGSCQGKTYISNYVSTVVVCVVIFKCLFHGYILSISDILVSLFETQESYLDLMKRSL